MKKFAVITALLAVLAIAVSVTGFAVFAEPDVIKSSDGSFEYTKEGTVLSYYGEENVFVPAQIDGTKIKEIGVLAFWKKNIITVYMEEGIALINTNAFEESEILYADIPASVATVGERAFANCKKLVEVTLNSENVNFEPDAFAGTNLIQFNIRCSADEKALRNKMLKAKGDANFSFKKNHMSTRELADEKDVFGENMFYCEDCGYKGSKFLDDAPLPFDDVKSDAWYASYVKIAFRNGILSGKSETIFDPEAGMTCAEAVKIASCIHEFQTEHPINRETGNGGEWYEPYFDYCRREGIIEDYIILKPNEKITRAQMAYLFARCDAEPFIVNPDIPLTDIPDVHDTTAFAYEILELYRRGIVMGSDDRMTFYPDSQVKRCEAAAFISRILSADMRIELSKG